VQSFADPQSADSSARPEAPSQPPVDIIDEPPAARPQLPAAVPSIKPRDASELIWQDTAAAALDFQQPPFNSRFLPLS
jgi:hypothetical protein